MKLNFLSLLIFASGLLFLVACNNEEGTTDDFRETSFTAEFAGQSWSAESSFSKIDEPTNTIQIQGMTEDVTIHMTLLGVNKGSFDLDESGNNLILTTNSKTYTYLPGTGGQVEITLNNKVDHALSGVFAGMVIDTTLDTIAIENGAFNHILYIDTTSSSGGPDICTADAVDLKVDGNVMAGTILAQSISGFIQINKIDGTTSSVSITFPSTIDAGSYSFDGTTYVCSFNENASTFFSADSGTLVIEDHDKDNKQIKGSFSATVNEVGGAGVREITEGSFCVSY